MDFDPAVCHFSSIYLLIPSNQCHYNDIHSLYTAKLHLDIKSLLITNWVQLVNSGIAVTSQNKQR